MIEVLQPPARVCQIISGTLLLGDGGIALAYCVCRKRATSYNYCSALMCNTIKAKISQAAPPTAVRQPEQAAAAAAFVEKLCQEHGISPDECSPDYDPDRDVAIYWCMGKPFKRVDHAAVSAIKLLNTSTAQQ